MFPGGPVWDPGGGADEVAALDGAGPVVGGTAPIPFGEAVDVDGDGPPAPVSGAAFLDAPPGGGEPFNA